MSTPPRSSAALHVVEQQRVVDHADPAADVLDRAAGERAPGEGRRDEAEGRPAVDRDRAVRLHGPRRRAMADQPCPLRRARRRGPAARLEGPDDPVGPDAALGHERRQGQRHAPEPERVPHVRAGGGDALQHQGRHLEHLERAQPGAVAEARNAEDLRDPAAQPGVRRDQASPPGGTRRRRRHGADCKGERRCAVGEQVGSAA